MGTVGIMTGWERHSLRSIPVVKVGKVRVQKVRTGGHTFMLTKCVSPWSSTDRVRGEKHWGFERVVEGHLFLGESASNTSTLL